MIHFSLFSGIGGFELASEWAGWKNYLSCEINSFGNKVLNHYWPDAYHHEDIHTLNYEVIDNELTKRYGSDWRSDDIILTGGFPCQPYSAAGKRLGKEDDRHLWPEMCRVIREVRPKWVVGENVFGLVNWNGGLVFDEVQADLEAEGYEVQPYVLPAASVGAPHRRDRIWFVAYAKSAGTRKNIRGIRSLSNGFGKWKEGDAPDTEGGRSRQLASEDRGRQDRRPDDDGTIQYAPDTNSRGLEGSKEIGWNGINAEWKSKFGYASDSNSKGLQRWKSKRNTKDRKWENNAEMQLGRCDIRGSWNNWQDFPTQSPICSGDDGLPSQLDGITFPKWRNESIKAYGNAIVPQVAYQIFKAINDYGKI